MTGSQYSCISPCNIPQHSLIISVGNSGLAWYSSSQDWLPGYLAVSILPISSQSGTGDGTFQNHCKHHQINRTMVSSLLPIIFAYFLGGVVLPGHVVHVSHHVSTTTPDSTNPKKPRNKKCSLLPDNKKMLRFWKFYITKSVTHKLRHRSLLGYFHDFHLIGSCHRPAPWNIKWTWMGIGMRNLDLKLKHGWTKRSQNNRCWRLFRADLLVVNPNTTFNW